MKRMRIGTLMLLVSIVALGIALVVEHSRASRREARLRAELARNQNDLDACRKYVLRMKVIEYERKQARSRAEQEE